MKRNDGQWVKQARLRSLCMLTLLAASAVASAQGTWPARPVRIIAADSAGGVADAVIRAISDKLQQKLGQPFVPDFRPGAGGTIAGAALARAAPDGYTLMLTTLSVSGTAPWIYKAPQYDPARDFAAVARLVEVPSVLYVKAGSRIATFRDFLQVAKDNPGRINVGVVGLGSSNHLTGVLIERAARIAVTYVPYKSGADSMQSVLSGTTDASISNVSTIVGQIQARNLVPLASTGKTRAAQLPDVPTVAESGFANFDVTSWYGLLAPARTPQPVVDRLSGVVGELLKDPEVLERYRRLGAESGYRPAVEFDAWLKDELAKWRPVVEAAGIAGSQ